MFRIIKMYDLADIESKCDSVIQCGTLKSFIQAEMKGNGDFKVENKVF